MTIRSSQGPFQLTSLDLPSVNYALQVIRRELDEIKGLRGAVTFHSRVNLDSAQFDSATAPSNVTETDPTTDAAIATAIGAADTLSKSDHAHYHGPLLSTASLHDHGVSLDGLTDDDHTQYALLEGRFGGQTLKGDTNGGGNLTLDGDGVGGGGVLVINNLGVQGFATFAEQSATPGDPSNGVEVRAYMKGDKFILQFNDAGTVRYKYLDLTGTGVTWTHTTVAP